ncbi:histidine kinase [Selenihalanaerobacter shriftii]|uniref:Uncharacterized protein n=1 Tax=Selenihalanaerobacter shriftii TaxID=142842 RepID=A0A1T4Q993_9FIRM|nr:histidine kinase [Selenihalanaerobacter shriftii]SKA00206.1 hypothetical protein SAMN02745118_02479 [Selenihalanaerobacter shriftii]
MSQENIQDKIKDLNNEIKDLQRRMPAHSIKIEMMQKLEDLKAELNTLKSKLDNS